MDSVVFWSMAAFAAFSTCSDCSRACCRTCGPNSFFRRSSNCCSSSGGICDSETSKRLRFAPCASFSLSSPISASSGRTSSASIALRRSSESCFLIRSSTIFAEAAAGLGGMTLVEESTGATLPSAAAGTRAQSFGKVCNPQKFSGRSKRAPSLQLRRSEPIGWQSTTCAVVSRPSWLWKCKGTPAFSFTGERIAQPWALTIKVSQTSEKLARGSRLVTRIGTAIGTLELRRNVGTFELCIASASLRGVGAARPTIGERPVLTTLTPSSLESANL